MKRRGVVLLLLLIVTGISGIRAQHSNVLYFMDLQQRNSLNPALHSSGKVYVGIPLISDDRINLDNNFLSLSDIFNNGIISDSTLSFSDEGEALDRFIEGLNDKNSLEPQISVQLLGLGFSIGKYYFTFDIRERVEGNIVFPGDLLRLAFYGDDQFNGQRIDMSSLRTDMKCFSEMGFGLSRSITPRLRAGVRGKVYFGQFSANLENRNLALTVNNDYSYALEADMALNTSGLMNFVADENGYLTDVNVDTEWMDSPQGIISFLTETANTGFGLDLGMEYQMTDRISLSAAVTDFGFIRWQQNVSRLEFDKDIEFNALTMQDVYDETVTMDELLQDIGDTLKYAVKLAPDTGPFTTYMPVGITVGGSYELTDFLTLGVVSYSKFIGRQVHESVTVSGNVNLGNYLSTTLAYTAANDKYANLGFGFALRAGFMQLYTLADYIPLKWTKVTAGEDSFSIPEYWNTVHFRFGINLVFGNREKNRDKPVD